MYLCYDIKGIQRFIFSVPKLKCVIGASGMIANFDRQTANDHARSHGAERIFSGGGRGAFYCASGEAADQLAEALILAAHDQGLDIRIGMAQEFSEAAHHADRLYPFSPETLEGEPCEMSGLWPVPRGRFPKVKEGVHPLIWERVNEARRDALGNLVVREWRQRGQIPAGLGGYELAFFKNVHPDPDDDEEEMAEARAGQAALGGRNRWAVVAMDGNDMGRQFLVPQREHWPEEKTLAWLKCASAKLEECTREAFLTALGMAVEAWARTASDEGCLERCIVRRDGRPVVVLPFRPLILGGDDVTVLCHPSYALPFAVTMAKAFREQSRKAAQEASVKPLWPATDGELTISAGILYAKTSFPLHTAIPYAESLLASAKGRFRASPEARTPTPAAVDWDSITDSMVDTPAARRHRELRFLDSELGVEVRLTRRPYLLEAGGRSDDLASLLELKERLKREVPPSVRARVLPSLQRPWSQRVAFVASVAKRHPILMEQLWEGDAEPGTGWSCEGAEKARVTGLPDALLLLEEEHRADRPTVDR